jgi:hypothetical protein
MNINWTLLLVSVLILFSCERELISVKKTNSTYQEESSSHPRFSKNPTEQIASGMSSEENTHPIASNSTSENLIEKKIASFPEKAALKEEIASETKNVLKTKKEIKINKRPKKEKDPRLTTALIMTIFGGLATTLGIVFNKYAPTGLFVFVFAIIFIIGLISLFMYLANPKPKM